MRSQLSMAIQITFLFMENFNEESSLKLLFLLSLSIPELVPQLSILGLLSNQLHGKIEDFGFCRFYDCS
jgi:hypothetical protein